MTRAAATEKAAFGVLLATFIASGCGGGAPEPTTADAARAAERWPGTDVSTLNQGRSLYVRRCGNCHALYAPAELTESEWRASVAEMRERAHVQPNEEGLILKYLVTVGASRGPHAPGGTQ